MNITFETGTTSTRYDIAPELDGYITIKLNGSFDVAAPIITTETQKQQKKNMKMRDKSSSRCMCDKVWIALIPSTVNMV